MLGGELLKRCKGWKAMLSLSLLHAQDADDEDLPPLEEDVDEGSRMEVRCCLLSFVIMQYAWHSTLSSLLCSTMLQAVYMHLRPPACLSA